MAVTIKLKNASGSDPSASDLVVGEVALRTDSGQLFTKKDNGSIQEIGAASGVSDGDKGDITVSSSGSTFTIDNGVVSTAKIADDAVTIAKLNLISTTSAPSLEAKGTSGSTDGYIQLNCSENSHGIKLKSPPHSAGQSYTLTFPSSIVNNGFLKTDSSGNLSFATISSDLVNDTSPQLGGNLDTNTRNIQFGDSAASTDDRLTFGAGTDLSIYHNGTDNYIDTVANKLRIRVDNSNDAVVANSGGSVELYFSNNKKFETNNTGVHITNTLTAGGNLSVEDNGQILAGTGNDLSILHDATNSHITNITGNLNLVNNAAANIQFIHDNKVMLKAVADGTVELYHGMSSASEEKKLETTTGGVTITGTCTATTFSGSGASLTSLNASNISSGTIAAARVATLNQNTTGSAATLTTARTIAGASFDGSANIDISFNDLTNKPTIPTNNNQLTNGAGYITSAALSGAGDGGNAASLDGLDSTQFLRSDANDSTTGLLTLNRSDNEKLVLSGSSSPFIRFQESTTNKATIQWDSGGFLQLVNQEDSAVLKIKGNPEFSPNGSDFYAVWHAGNDGAGSGLDADKLDGETSSFYLNYNNLSNTPTIPTNNNQLTNGAGYVTTNTTYTADGDYGMNLSGTTFRMEDDRRRNSTSADIKTGNTHDYVFFDADVGMRFYTAGDEEMRLENDGDLHVDGDVTAFSTTVSDIRLKKDIEIIKNPLDILDKINGYTFTYKKGDKKSAGVVAQEVEKVFSQAVSEKGLPYLSKDEENPEKYKTVEYDQIVGLLVQAVKELTEKVKELDRNLHLGS